MDLEKVREQMMELRKRREFLPEIRDYKPQARAKTTKKSEPATPVGTRDTEDVFAALFAPEDTNGTSDNTPDTGTNETSGSVQTESANGSTDGQGCGASASPSSESNPQTGI